MNAVLYIDELLKMINSKDDLYYYLEADWIALGIDRKKPKIIGDEIWKYQILLRKIEYYVNSKKNIITKVYIYYLKYKFRNLGLKLGFSIPFNVFGPGLSIAHSGTIVVNRNAKIGHNCRIHTCVNIGTKAGYSDLSPHIGDNVYIGPGAKIFDSIKIADGIAIGANSVVNKSFLEENISIAGVPAKKISDKGSEGLLIKATELI
jgi:serine O-acetyltransferase